MSATLRTHPDAPTDRAIRRLSVVASMRRQDRNHSARMALHIQQADALLDELLALHPEMRAR